MVEKVIGLYGVPRSGTSWLGQIFDSCEDVIFKFQPLFSYAFKDRIQTNSSKEDIEKYFSELICKEDVFLDQNENRVKGRYPIFKKNSNVTQLVYKEANYLYTIPILLNKIERIKMVAIIRNPYDVMESWINAPSEFKETWNVYNEWQFAQSKNEYRPENFFGYNKWKEALMLFCAMEEKYPNNFRIIQYENLVENAIECVGELYDFCGLKITGQTMDFVIKSQTDTVESVYSVFRKKGEKRERKQYLPDSIKEKIREDLLDFVAARRFGYDTL